MRLDDLAGLDLNRLVVLAILLEERSVSRAARRLGRTQSALSHSLAGLRENLKDDLLVRAGPALVPTPFAAALFEELRPVLESLGALTQREGFDPRTATRTFRVGWSDYLQLVVGRPWLAAVRAAAPGIDIETYPSAAAGPYPQLADGSLDLSFDVGLADFGSLRSRLLFQDEFVTFVGAQVGGAGPLTLEDFVATPHVLVAPRGDPSGPVDRALAAMGMRRRVAIRLAHFIGVVEIVRDSQLITTLPRRLLQAMGAPEDRIHAAPLQLPPLRVRVVWHPRTQRDAGIAWLRQSLVDAMNPDPAMLT